MTLNQNGAVMYNNIGEINPTVVIESCFIENNGILLLNLTSPPIVDITVYNSKTFSFSTNYIGDNYGGIELTAFTLSIATALRGNITNNIFVKGRTGEVLKIDGHHFQRMYVRDNFFFENKAGSERSNINIDNVAVDFVFNIVENNTGYNNLLISSQELTDTLQVFSRNSFKNNNATSPSKSTIHVERGKPAFVHNFIVNELNNFEVEANKKPNHTSNNIAINATENWWGSVHTSYINGRIWDNHDDISLTTVDFTGFKTSLTSVMDGKCLPGWTLDANRCYRYMGGAVSYHRAELFCKEQDGFLAEIKGRQEFMKRLLQISQNIYDSDQRVWVYASVSLYRCSAFRDTYVVEEQDCGRLLLPFVCEKDPYILPPSSDVYTTAIAVATSVFGLLILIIIIIAILAYIKSKKRKEHRKEMLASVESLTLIGSRRGRSSLGGSRASLSSRRTMGSREYLGTSREMLSSRADSIDNLQRYHASISDSRESLPSKKFTPKVSLANSSDRLASSREQLASMDTPRGRTGLYDRRKFSSNETLESKPRSVFPSEGGDSDYSDESDCKNSYPAGQTTQTSDISDNSEDNGSIEKKPIPDSPGIHGSQDNLSLSSFQKPHPLTASNHITNNNQTNGKYNPQSHDIPWLPPYPQSPSSPQLPPYSQSPDSPQLPPALKPRPKPKPKPLPKPKPKFRPSQGMENSEDVNDNRLTIDESQLPLLYNRNRQSGGGVILPVPTRNETEI